MDQQVAHSSEVQGEYAKREALLRRIAEELAPTFSGVFAEETVMAYITDAYERLAADANVTAFLPILTRRIARDDLQRLAHQGGVVVPTTPEVLFVCVHNAGRSQMAAALLEHHAQGRVVVRSAGSEPGEALNPLVVKAMAEVGLDISDRKPKVLSPETVAESDVVVTMGCGDACPIFPGKRYEDWVLTDPATQDLAGVRDTRDDIDRRVQALVADLTGTAS